VGGPQGPPVKYHYFHSFFTDSVERSWGRKAVHLLELSGGVGGAFAGRPTPTLHDPVRGQCQAGSLTGAVHLSKGNAGVLRPAQRGQKPRVEQKGKCWLDPDFQYEYGPRKRGLSILLS
jgi:hypothetical protein